MSAEISRRVSSILDAVEEEAARIRAEANAEATAELVRARRQADELVRERRARIAALSDELLAKTEAILGRLDDAEPIYIRFDRLIHALGDAAEKLAAEAGEAPSPPEPGDEPDSTASADDVQRPETYVPPRSSSFWRAARSGATQLPPPAGPIAGPSLPEPDRIPPPNLDAARGAARQLATRGASREEIENHLRLIHGLADPDEILSETFAALEGDKGRRGRT